jgi:hypothetical protein
MIANSIGTWRFETSGALGSLYDNCLCDMSKRSKRTYEPQHFSEVLLDIPAPY